MCVAESPRPQLFPLEGRMERGDRCAHEGSQFLTLGVPLLWIGYTSVAEVPPATVLLGWLFLCALPPSQPLATFYVGKENEQLFPQISAKDRRKVRQGSAYCPGKSRGKDRRGAQAYIDVPAITLGAFLHPIYPQNHPENQRLTSAVSDEGTEK